MRARCVHILEIITIALIANRAKTLIQHHFRKAHNCGHGRPNFMAHARKKIALLCIGQFGCALGCNKVSLRLLPRRNIAHHNAIFQITLRADPTDGRE